MFNRDLKKQAIADFEKTKKTYDQLSVEIKCASKYLMKLRQENAHTAITQVESLFTNIANKPKDFDKTFIEYKAEFKVFTDILDHIKSEARKVELQAGGASGAGIAAGIGVVSFAPTAAMAIATTFGTASTGTAIASLSGAAATNAALAWLGGGALTVGGGGMIAGEGLLALAGPIGWGIGIAALTGGAIFASNKNAKISKEVNEKRKEVEVLNKQFQAASIEIDRLIKETTSHIEGMDLQFKSLEKTLTTFDYTKLDSHQKEMMISLKNHVESLSMLIKKKVTI